MLTDVLQEAIISMLCNITCSALVAMNVTIHWPLRHTS